MNYASIDIAIKPAIKLIVPEYYRVYANKDLLTERTINLTIDSDLILEQIVVKSKKPLITIKIEHTIKNYVKTGVYKILDIPFVTVDKQTIYPEIITKKLDSNLIFSFVNILFISV